MWDNTIFALYDWGFIYSSLTQFVLNPSTINCTELLLLSMICTEVAHMMIVSYAWLHLQIVQPRPKMNHIPKLGKCVTPGAVKSKLGPFNGVCYIKDNSIIDITISEENGE